MTTPENEPLISPRLAVLKKKKKGKQQKWKTFPKNLHQTKMTTLSQDRREGYLKTKIRGEKMNFTEDEKKVLRYILDEHIKDVEKNETLVDSPPVLLAAELRYDDFLKNLMEKLES